MSFYEAPSRVSTLFYIHSALYRAVTKSNLSLALRAYVGAQSPLQSTYKFIDRYGSDSVIVILLCMSFRIFICFFLRSFHKLSSVAFPSRNVYLKLCSLQCRMWDSPCYAHIFPFEGLRMHACVSTCIAKEVQSTKCMTSSISVLR